MPVSRRVTAGGGPGEQPNWIADQDAASTGEHWSDFSPGLWAACFAVGLGLGIVFVKSEVLSWYRIQEMFRFQSFHMFGVIGSAVAVASASIALLRRVQARAATGDAIVIAPKMWTRWGARYWIGGLVFGLGWALLGACPGPIFTLIGLGETVFLVPLVAAAGGTYAYGAIRHRLPH